jgi:nitroreductase
MTLLEAISARHSVRKYIDKDIPADIIAALQDKIAECNKAGNLSIQLVLNEARAFTGMLSYGQFSGVKNYLVMVGKKSKDLDERVGYYGEQLVLFAQTLGLNTCWVGLSYRKVPEAYNVGKDEKLACMIALGYGETQGVCHKIKSVEEVSRSAVRTTGTSRNVCDTTPSWFRKGVEAALLAPTAVNQQKFSFEYVGMSNNRHQVRAMKGFSMIGYTLMDLGIAKCHFEIGAGKNNFDWVS